MRCVPEFENWTRSIGVTDIFFVLFAIGTYAIEIWSGGTGATFFNIAGRQSHSLNLKRLRLIDFDQVTLSSLNRHAVAIQDDVGTPKSVCLEKHFLQIAPHSSIDARNQLFTLNAAPELLSGNPDYVLGTSMPQARILAQFETNLIGFLIAIDCIDNLNTKIDLIKYCKDNGIRVISSMGAGAKADPSRIQIADISETFGGYLA